MKVAIISDVHVGNHKAAAKPSVMATLNSRCMGVLNALDAACSHVLQDGHITALIVAGDLFDNTNPSAGMMFETVATLKRVTDAGRQVIVLTGNHEIFSEAVDDHVLSTLEFIKAAVRDSSRRGSFALHGGYGERVYVMPYLRDLAGVSAMFSPPGVRLVVSHFGIHTPEMLAAQPWLEHSGVPLTLVRELCAAFGFDAWMSGDWHGHAKLCDDPAIWQIGALVPTGWDNPGLEGYGSLVEVDFSSSKLSCTRVEIPGPRFVTVTEQEFATLCAGGRKPDLYVRVRVSEDRYRDAAHVIRELSANNFAHVEISVQREAVLSVVDRAVQVTRRPESLTGVVHRFVDGMLLPKDVAKDEVLRRSLNLLGLS